MLTRLLAEAAATRTTYDFERWQSFGERWHVLALLAVCAAVLVFVASLYRRDSVELRPGLGLVLLVFRLIALVGVLAYFLELEKRTEQTATHNSRVLVLVDTSLSMGMQDADRAANLAPADASPGATTVNTTPNRLEQVAALLDAGGFIRRLREVHDVVLVRFDAEINRLATLTKSRPPVDGQTEPQSPENESPETPPSAPSNSGASSSGAPAVAGGEKGDWKKSLRPHGVETRLGQALRDLIHEERAAPVSGVVVFSDGGQNAGIDTQSAILAARDAKVPVFAVGVGSDRRPAGVRIADFVAPARAYPGDSFTVTGYLQAQELAGRTVAVELTSRPAGDAAAVASAKSEGTEQVLLGGNTETIPVKFTLTPGDTGRRTYRLEVKPPPEDRNLADNRQEVDVEIVDRKTKILLFASGPTREYIFLRNQLRRDSEMIVDVVLQSGQKGISQDANEILDTFPSEAQTLFQYDAIVCFDPDWLALDEDQVELLERWVAEKAGGLIVIAGPVEMDRWVSENRMGKIRGLYPVEFTRRLTLMEEGRFGSESVWPLDFTREGLEAEFLWLGDNASASAQAWASFPGVYGYYGVHGAKPGATVYARYSDPESASSGQLPVYMAGHFYGSGRVFYLGSGEMWRLRAVDESYFEQLYTKLIRHVSQGRLLVGSSRGMLLVDRDRYLLGSTVLVRAQLSDSQFEPLSATQVPLAIVQPDGTLETLELVADRDRKGMFAGQFSALKEGTYRLDLAVPDAGDEQLERRIQVKVPELEREHPERNDALLSDLAQATGGLYYVGPESVLGKTGLPELAAQLPDRTETTYLSGVKDLDFEKRWMWTLLAVIAGALFLEWTLRRLLKTRMTQSTEEQPLIRPEIPIRLVTVIQLAPAIAALLARLRRGIRVYSWSEGIALLVALLAGSFWLSLALDWCFEPPAPLRVALLVAVGLLAAWVTYRFILRRVFVHLADRSLALVLERRFSQFRDSLVTAVELSQTPAGTAGFDPEMLSRTQQQALAGAAELELGRVFDLGLLLRRGLLAFVLLAAVIGFGLAESTALGIWARRSLMLSDEMWPRKTHLTAVGFDAEGRTKIARGADLELLVQADAAPGREVPEVVEIRYGQGSSRGRETMGRSGNAPIEPGSSQNYIHGFKAVLTPLEFYVRGGDDRLGPLYVDVVDSPTVGQMVLHCEYPTYMNREPRDLPVAGAMSVPRGTSVTVRAETNKDVVQVQVDDLSEAQTPIAHKIDLAAGDGVGQRQFEYLIPALDRDTTLRFTLVDVDGIRSRDPLRLALAALDDEAPQVHVQLTGIGTAITPQARLPLTGEISDDYGVAKAWFECHVDDAEPVEQPFAAKIDGRDRLPVNEAIEVERFKLEPKHKFHLVVEAADTCGLADGPKVGISQRDVLDVVTPEQLRSILEARELLLRRRFETIVQELTESRDALVRIDMGLGESAGAGENKEKPAESANPKQAPADAASPTADSPAAADRHLTLRRVQAERALQNCQRSVDETLGVATAFDSIREELINNRVDTEELKIRLKDGIADPLRRICSEMFPELERRLQTLQAKLTDPQAAATARDAAREEADAILVQMSQILDKMLEVETFNEVLDLLRGIIDSQEKINRETKQKQKDKLKELLDEDEGAVK